MRERFSSSGLEEPRDTSPTGSVRLSVACRNVTLALELGAGHVSLAALFHSVSPLALLVLSFPYLFVFPETARMMTEEGHNVNR